MRAPNLFQTTSADRNTLIFLKTLLSTPPFRTRVRSAAGGVGWEWGRWEREADCFGESAFWPPSGREWGLAVCIPGRSKLPADRLFDN